MGNQVVRKISIKTVVGDVKDMVPERGTKQLMQIVGIVHGIRTGTSQFGDFISLKGTFSAANLESGEIFRSNQCFLPEHVTDAIHAQLMVEGVKSVEFAFNIGIKKFNNPIGYEYTASPLIEMDESDPLDSLLKRLPPPETKKVE